jgi:non-ribosomal peptide synthetase component F
MKVSVGTFNYNIDLFDAASIERMVGHFEHLIEAAVANPDEPVSRLQLLSVLNGTRCYCSGTTHTGDFGENSGGDRPVHLAFRCTGPAHTSGDCS